MKLAMMIVAGLVLAVVLLFAARSYMSRNNPPELGLVGGVLRVCGERPNCVGSETSSGDHRIEPLAYVGDRAATEAAVSKAFEAMGLSIQRRQGDYWHAIAVSRLFRFIDDVELRFDDGARLIHIRSASRVGHSDLGVNRKRVEALRAALK